MEDNAVWNGWFGTLMETASENLFLNEMLVTKAGNPVGDIIKESLERKLGPKMGKVANFFITTPLPSVDFIPYAYTTPIVKKVVLGGKEF